MEGEGKTNDHDDGPHEAEDPAPRAVETEDEVRPQSEPDSDGQTESADEEGPERERDEDGGDQHAPPHDSPTQDAPPQDAPGIPARQDAEIPSGKVARTTTTERTWDQEPAAEPDPERGAVSDARARERGLLEGHPEDRGADESSEMEADDE